MNWVWIAVAVLGAGVLAYGRARLWMWTVAGAIGLAALNYGCPWAAGLQTIIWAAFIGVAVVMNVAPLRRQVVTRPVFALFRKILPAMSDTEREALEAGTVWWEAELFNGAPRLSARASWRSMSVK